MKPLLSQLWKLVLISLIGLMGSGTAGLMRYGSDTLQPSNIAFAYVAFGLSGALIFAFYHVRGLSTSITAAVTIGAVQFGVSALYLPILNAALWSYRVNMCVVVIAFLFERKLEPLKQFKFIAVSLIYGMVFVLLTLLVAVLTGVQSLPASVFRENFIDGLLIGLGLGLGVEIAESVVHSVEIQK
jgi:thiamine transporter ThiT